MQPDFRNFENQKFSWKFHENLTSKKSYPSGSFLKMGAPRGFFGVFEKVSRGRGSGDDRPCLVIFGVIFGKSTWWTTIADHWSLFREFSLTKKPQKKFKGRRFFKLEKSPTELRVNCLSFANVFSDFFGNIWQMKKPVRYNWGFWWKKC